MHAYLFAVIVIVMYIIVDKYGKIVPSLLRCQIIKLVRNNNMA